MSATCRRFPMNPIVEATISGQTSLLFANVLTILFRIHLPKTRRFLQQGLSDDSEQPVNVQLARLQVVSNARLHMAAIWETGKVGSDGNWVRSKDGVLKRSLIA